MKRGLTILALGTILALSGCGNSNTATESTTEITTEQENSLNENTSNGKVLTVYFSWASNVENDDVDGISSASIVDGNYHLVADYVNNLVGGDVFEIKTDEKYPVDYNKTVDIAADEKKNDARPSLTSHIDNISDYDTIVLIYPNWWGTYPMAVATFLQEYDFNGKTILPLCTNEGSGMGSSEEDLSKLVTNANIKEGLAIRGGKVENSQKNIEQWLKDSGVL